jgi:hypothetical protein
VARTGDLDGVLQNVKFSVSNYVHNAGLQPEILALHFGKSERSIYRYFDMTRQGQKKSDTVKDARVTDPGKEKKPTDAARETRRSDFEHDGVQLMGRILEFYYTRREAIQEDVCVRYLRRSDPTVSPANIKGLLELYAKMGHLKRITEEDGGVRVVKYRAPDQVMLANGMSDSQERLKQFNKKIRALLPLLLGYLRQEDGSSMVLLKGRVQRHHLVSALKDINDFAVRRWNQAVEASEMEEPDGHRDSVDACCYLLGGPGSMEELQIARGAQPVDTSRKHTHAVHVG